MWPGIPIPRNTRFAGTGDYVVANLKANAMELFKADGDNRLVKVIPTIEDDPKLSNDEQYPYGRGGVAQWKIIDKKGIPGKVVAVVTGRGIRTPR